MFGFNKVGFMWYSKYNYSQNKIFMPSDIFNTSKHTEKQTKVLS